MLVLQSNVDVFIQPFFGSSYGGTTYAGMCYILFDIGDLFGLFSLNIYSYSRIGMSSLKEHNQQVSTWNTNILNIAQVGKSDTASHLCLVKTTLQ